MADPARLNPRSRRRLLLWVTAATLLVRLFYFVEHSDSAFFHVSILDEKFYDDAARQLAAGESIAEINPAFRPLLYPAVLASLYRLAEPWGPVAAIVLQHLLGTLTTVLVALLALELFASIPAAALAAALYGLAGPPLFFEGELLITSLFTFLMTCLLWLCLRLTPSLQAGSPATPGRWLLAGLWLALTAQARSNALLLLLAFPLAAWLATDRRRAFGLAALTWMATAASLMLFGVLQQPWLGRFQMLPAAGGINLYLGNKAGADGMVPRQDHHVAYGDEYRDSVQLFSEQVYRQRHDLPPNQVLEPSQVSRFWVGETMREIAAEPLRWLDLMARKTMYTLWNREIPNNKNFAFITAHESPLLRWLPVRWWCLLAFGAVGAGIAWRRQPTAACWPILLLALHAAGMILFFVNSRYRIPLWPIMAVLAGGGLVALLAALRRRSTDLAPGRNTLLAWGTALILAICSWVNWFGVEPQSFARDFFFRSLANLEKGRLDAALADAQQAVELEPNNAAAQFQLGNVALTQNKNRLALRSFDAARKLEPDEPRVFNNLGIALERSGQIAPAYAAYQRAARQGPTFSPPWVNAALIELRAGLLRPAERRIRHAESLGTPSVALLCARAFLEKEHGRIDRANELIALARAEDAELVERLVKDHHQKLRRKRLQAKRPKKTRPKKTRPKKTRPKTPEHNAPEQGP